MIDIRVQAGSFDPGRQIHRLKELGQAGLASFTGTLVAGEEVSEVQIEHYPALAKSELARIAEEAEARWSLAGAIIIHRHGRFSSGEQVLFAAAACADPAGAIEACAFLVAAVRERAPFWRKDLLADGTSRWI